jgi:hypothetical protein
MTRPNALPQEGGFTTTPLITALAAVLLLTVGGVAWVALHPPAKAVVTPVAPVSVAPPDPVETPTQQPASSVPAKVLDENARTRLRYAWLVASDYARVHGSSFTGLSPAVALHRLRATLGDVTLPGEGPLALTRFDRADKATAGAVSIRVADGQNLLLVTRSRTGTAYCFVQRGEETGGGVGDAARIDQCVIRWG